MTTLAATLTLWLTLSSVTLTPYRDRVTGEDLSGNGQITEVGKPVAQPLLVQVWADGQPAAGTTVEVLTTFRDTLIHVTLRADDQGIVRYRPPAFLQTGEGHVVFRTHDSLLQYTFHVVPRNWFYILLFQILGGFAIFFFGLDRSGKGMMRLSGGRIRRYLFNLTRNPLLGLGAGFLATVMLQSSTATTVMLISFVTAGLISLQSAIAAALGAGVGTTLTVQIIALRVFDLALILLLFGYLLERVKGNVRNFGRVLFGFGLIFLGIKLMATGASSMSLYPWFQSGLHSLQGNIPALLFLSFFFTALVHSSAATIGVVLSLAFSQLVQPLDAFVMVLGANLGTSMTALLASLTAERVAKRLALMNVLTKLVGVLVFLVLLHPVSRLMNLLSHDLAREVANFHTFFNLVVAVAFFPFLPVLERLSNLILPRREEVPGERLVPELLADPDLALSFTHRRVIQMGDRVYWMLRECIQPFLHRNPAQIYRIVAEDDNVDRFEEEITPFLTRLMEEELTQDLIARIKALLFTVDELEHIGDVISKSIMRYAERMYKDGLEFSEEGKHEIQQFHQEVLLTMEHALAALTTFERGHARQAALRKDIVNTLEREFHMMHLDRLAKGTKETILTSTIHLDLISDLERINFHAASIGLTILEQLWPEKRGT